MNKKFYFISGPYLGHHPSREEFLTKAYKLFSLLQIINLLPELVYGLLLLLSHPCQHGDHIHRTHSFPVSGRN